MAFNFNSVTLVGRLIKDPDIKKIGETTISKLTIAIDRPYKNKDGNIDTDFINIKMFNKLAEISHMLKKGMPILVQGRLQINSWDDNGTKRYITEIAVDTFQILQNKEKTESKPASVMQEPLQETPFDYGDGDKNNPEGIPF